MKQIYTDETYKESLDRVDDVLHGRQPDRVPTYALASEWMFFNAGYSQRDIEENPTLCYDSFKKMVEDVYFDTTLGPQYPRALVYKEKLGGGNFEFSSSGIIQWNSTNVTCMNEDEYPQLIENPWKFFMEVVLPRKYSKFALQDPTEKYNALCEAWDAKVKATSMMPETMKRCREDVKVPVIFDPSTRYWHPFDVIMDYYRNFAGIMTDIRRRPQEVIAACDAIQPQFLGDLHVENRKAPKGTAIMYPLHAPTFLKAKDYEKFYWPWYKELVEYVNRYEYILLAFFEGKHEHLYDFYETLPKHTIAGMFEFDDLKKTKQRLGDNLCIIGGMDTFLLKHGTKEECIDMAKKVVEELAPGGAYMATTNKQLSCCIKEVETSNYAAVNDWIRDNTKY